MGKTLFSQSFDENFLSPKYQRNNIIKKKEEKTFDGWNVVSIFNEVGFLLQQTNYYKKERKSDYEYEYSISDSLLTIRRINKMNNEINNDFIEKYYYSSSGQCNKFEIYSSKNMQPFYFVNNFMYSDGLLISCEEDNISRRNKNSLPIKKTYQYNSKKQKIQEIRILNGIDTTYYSFQYNQYGQLSNYIQKSKGATYSDIICWSDSMDKLHIRYINFDKHGNWTKSYFVTKNGIKFRSKRKIEY